MTTRQIRLGEQTQGLIPSDQLATGTDTAGFVPIADGTGAQAWGAMTGGGGGSGECDHQHVTERFTAAGATPETFTLSHTPLWDVRVHVQGLRADSADIVFFGLTVDVDTTLDDVVLIDYERECSAPDGGVIYDGDAAISGPVNWYYVMTEAAFAALTPGAWAADTFYIPGALIFEDGSYFTRIPSFSRLSDSVGNEPAWNTTTEGDWIADLNGFWLRLLDAFVITDPLQAWVANTMYGTGGDLIAVDGHVYVGDSQFNPTGATQPVFPIDPTAGIDRMYPTTIGAPVVMSLSRPYSGGSISVTRNSAPVAGGDITETAPAEALVELDMTTWAIDDVLVISYTAV